MRRPVWNWWQKKRALGHYVNATPEQLPTILSACQTEMLNSMIDEFYPVAATATATKAQVTALITKLAAKHQQLVIRATTGPAAREPRLRMPGRFLHAYDNGASAVNELDQQVAALLSDLYARLNTQITKHNTVTRAFMDPPGGGANPVVCNAHYICADGTIGELGTGRSTADGGGGGHAEEKWFLLNVETTTGAGRTLTNGLQNTLVGLTSNVTRIEFNITIPVCHDEATCRTKLASFRTKIDEARTRIRASHASLAAWNRIVSTVPIYVFIYRNNEFWPLQFPAFEVPAAGKISSIPSGYWH